MARRYYQRARRPYHRKKPAALKIKPAIDGSLKKVFATIGTPEKGPFVPDAFQLEALDTIGKADCLVTAPTGSGKTWIAEQAIARVLAEGGRSWYTSPLKALSNSKYADFSQIFGHEQVGILTGDRKENPEAPVIVGTTEILRNQLYDAMQQGESLSTDFVILDEAHYLGDEDRGVVWEEIMIYLPSRIPLLMLSATIGNAREIAAWLSANRRKACRVVAAHRRPVPLFPLFFHPGGTLLPLLSPTPKSTKPKMSKRVDRFLKSKSPPLLASPQALPPFDQILRVLGRYRLLPAIFFLKSRSDCDRAVEMFQPSYAIASERKKQLCNRIYGLLQQQEHIRQHRQRVCLEEYAVGAHHSGQLPSWKILLETLMTEGMLDAIFATSTVAAGVNFPARTIVLLNSDRFNGTEFVPLSPTEFHQMTGRAGRRGMDRIGFAVVVPGKFMQTRFIGRLIHTESSPVASQIRVNFSMALNLLLSHDTDQIEALLKKSFASYCLNKQAKKRKRHKGPRKTKDFLWHDFKRHLAFLKRTGYVTQENTLTESGLWASRLRIDQPLLLAEGFRLGILPESDPGLLAAIVAAFVNERETHDRIDKKHYPKQLQKTFSRTKTGLTPLAFEMTRNGFYVPPLYFRPAVCIYAWAAQCSWAKALQLAEIEEGDLAMLILRTADNLRHIKALRRVFPQAAETADKAVELILREPVVMDYV